MADQQQPSSVKETVISIIISLAMALVAKAYVVEAFVIPTGSMAPTLLGKHMLFQSPKTGYEWAVNPWIYGKPPNGGPQQPVQIQQIQTSDGRTRTPNVTDPMTTSRVNPPSPAQREGYSITGEPKRLRAGDRILVQKMLYEIFGPERFDVVVFKNPENPTENFIKRLVGLPGEALIIIDGDIFTTDAPDGRIPSDWDAFQIRRKPIRVQSDIWRPIFSSEFTPPNPKDAAGQRFFITPWEGEGWTTTDQRIFTTQSTAPTTLTWQNDIWPINDFNPYNEIDHRFGYRGGPNFLKPSHYFPVADLRLRAGIEAGAEGLSATASINARGCTYEAVLDNGNAALRMRTGEGPWTNLASAPVAKFAPGRTIDVEFWHWDQRLALFVAGKKVLEADYDWNPSDRMNRSVGVRPVDLPPGDRTLENQSSYTRATPTVSWRFEGAPLRLHRVGLDKDIYWRPDNNRRGSRPGEFAVMNKDQLFVLGDNSAASADGRKWSRVDDEVKKIDPTIGIVPERLLLGKAFFVYFPSPHNMGRIPVPDLGRMRAIN